jgi:hypothetical protein
VRWNHFNNTIRTPRTQLRRSTNTTRLGGAWPRPWRPRWRPARRRGGETPLSDMIATKTRRASCSGAHREHDEGIGEGRDALEWSVHGEATVVALCSAARKTIERGRAQTTNSGAGSRRWCGEVRWRRWQRKGARDATVTTNS